MMNLKQLTMKPGIWDSYKVSESDWTNLAQLSNRCEEFDVETTGILPLLDKADQVVGLELLLEKGKSAYQISVSRSGVWLSMGSMDKRPDTITKIGGMEHWNEISNRIKIYASGAFKK